MRQRGQSSHPDRQPLVRCPGRAEASGNWEFSDVPGSTERYCSPRSRTHTKRTTYLVIRRVGGCEVRLRRTIDLVHNIQTAHGSPQWKLNDFSSTLLRQNSAILHRRHLGSSSQVMGSAASGSALCSSGSRPLLSLPTPAILAPIALGTGAPRLQPVDI